MQKETIASTPPVMGGRPSKGVYGSDLMVEVLGELGIKYVALNPGASYRGLHDSLVNFPGNAPEIILCPHEEIAVGIANGYARVTGEPMATALHDVVGLQHACMAIFISWCSRTPVLNLGGGGPQDASLRRSTDWVHSALVQGNLVREFVKYDDQPMSLQATPESLIRAYRIGHGRSRAVRNILRAGLCGAEEAAGEGRANWHRGDRDAVSGVGHHAEGDCPRGRDGDCRRRSPCARAGAGQFRQHAADL